jgi:hypothetical protein
MLKQQKPRRPTRGVFRPCRFERVPGLQICMMQAGYCSPTNIGKHCIMKNELIETIKSGFYDRIASRERNTSTDSRNGHAIPLLTKIAGQVGNLTDGESILLQPYRHQHFRSVVSEAAKAIGFVPTVKDRPTFVRHLLAVLERQPVD